MPVLLVQQPQMPLVGIRVLAPCHVRPHVGLLHEQRFPNADPFAFGAHADGLGGDGELRAALCGDVTGQFLAGHEVVVEFADVVQAVPL